MLRSQAAPLTENPVLALPTESVSETQPSPSSSPPVCASTLASPTRTVPRDIRPVSPRTRIAELCPLPPGQPISVPALQTMDHHHVATPVMISNQPPPMAIHIEIPTTTTTNNNNNNPTGSSSIPQVGLPPQNYDLLDSARSPNYSHTQPHLFSPISPPPVLPIATPLHEFFVDFYRPDPRPTFVVKLPTQSMQAILSLGQSVMLPSSFDPATSYSSASVSTVDDLGSDLSNQSTQTSSLADTTFPKKMNYHEVPTSQSVDCGCQVVYRNPALATPEFRMLEEVLSGQNTLGRAREFWRWISGKSTREAIKTHPDLSAPKAPQSLFSEATTEHSGMTWTRHVIRGQWAVISTNKPRVPSSSAESPMSHSMVISMSRDEPFNVPLPLSPPIQEVMFDFSTSSSNHSHSSSTTSIDTSEIDESTILPYINTELSHSQDALRHPGTGNASKIRSCDARSLRNSPHDTPMDLNSAIDQLYITAAQQHIDSLNQSSSTLPTSDLLHRLEAVADSFPVGMCLSSSTGVIQFANAQWYKISGMSRTAGLITSCVADEHHANVERAFDQLNSQDTVTFEFRTKRPGNRTISINEDYESDNETNIYERIEQGERYMMATSRAERRANGRVFRILTVLSDVTAQKHSSAAAWRRAQNAENLKRMAEHATVGMYQIDLSGRIFSANDIFFTLTGQERVDLYDNEIKLWDLAFPDEENGSFEDRLKYVAASGQSWTNEVRLKTTWMADDGYGGRRPAPRWVVATMMPIQDHYGKVTSFTGCISDISHQKWQIERERQRKEEAIESKRQQENFIDMTSHEMRNPLGAIIQCADDIVNTLTELIEETEALTSMSHIYSHDHDSSIPESLEILSTPPRGYHSYSDRGSSPAPMTNWSPRHSLIHPPGATRDHHGKRLQIIEDCIEDAETIVACAQHQKRIVDDILTLSKLDAKLLIVTPVTVDPVSMVRKALKMFEAEARRVDVTLDFIIDPSFTKFHLPFLDFDPSRVTQILINLLSNALKFTQGRPQRTITVRLKASMDIPDATLCPIPFIKRLPWKASSNHRPTPGTAATPIPEIIQETTPDDALYLLFEVEDTGKGLTEDECRSLFNRFYQANSHTHVQHGGSGLGLFISRRLTELQKGAIGVKSQAGEGSIFAFYIQSMLPAAPAVAQAQSLASTQAIPQHLASCKNSADKGPKKPSIFQRLRARRPHKTPKNPPSGGLQCVLGPSQILVVEDNAINARVTKKGLTEHGFNVEVVSNGLEAIDKLTAQSQSQSPPPPQPSPIGKSLGAVLSEALGTSSASSHHLQIRPPPVFTAFRSRRSSASTALTGLSHAASATSLSTSSSSPGTNSIGMVLMDIEMPLQNGLDCTRQIRQLEREGKITCAIGGRIPIIAISGHARDEALAKAQEAGCDGVMVKPFRIPDLLETMKAVFKNMAETAVLEEEAEPRSKTERQHSV